MIHSQITTSRNDISWYSTALNKVTSLALFLLRHYILMFGPNKPQLRITSGAVKRAKDQVFSLAIAGPGYFVRQTRQCYQNMFFLAACFFHFPCYFKS